MRRFLAGARIFTGDEMLDGHGVLVDGSAILDICRHAADAAIEQLPEGSLLVPGFIDTQANGGGGVLFNATATDAGIARMVAAHRKLGTTGLLPTLITDRPEAMHAAAAAAARATATPGSGVLGLHLEGPFISAERRGVHALEFVRAPTPADLDFLAALPARLGAGKLLLSVAPEIVGDGAIGRLAAAGIVVAGAHSAASYERTEAAIAAGLHGFTHLFNAMPPLASRAPGIAAAALADPATFCGLIVDGIHVHPAMLRLALAAKPRGTLFLVTDAMPPLGTELTEFALYGATIRRHGGRLETADGTLAGADLDMATAVRNCTTLLGLDLAEALRMASLYPARFLGLDGARGRVAPGYVADLTLLAGDLGILGTWVAGTWQATN